MPKKICIVTCYKDPDYVRSRSLRAAADSLPDIQLIVIKNSNTGVMRYLEVLWKVLKVRFSQNPDVYILTFRGYEILPLLWFITIGKTFVFDEFINLIEWAVYENHKIKAGSFMHKAVQGYYKILLSLPDKILTDTAIHATYSSTLMNVPIAKYFPIPVSTDESVFKPVKTKTKDTNTFEVFYYSADGQPLHGIEYMCEAFNKLSKKYPEIHLTFIGGKEKAKNLIENARGLGANITHIARVPFEEIQAKTAQADLCLGGPFGATVQSQMVITGKTYQFLASQKPVVIGKINDNTGFVDKKNCLLIKQGSTKELIDAVVWAHQNRGEKLDDIARAGRKLYEERYSNNAVAERLRELINNLS